MFGRNVRKVSARGPVPSSGTPNLMTRALGLLGMEVRTAYVNPPFLRPSAIICPLREDALFRENSRNASLPKHKQR